MKGNLLHVLFVIIFFVKVNAQNVINPIWEKTEIGLFNNHAEAWGVDIDIQGNIYWSVNANNINQGLDISCYKFNTEGEALWNMPFFYGGIGAQQSYIVNVGDSSLYIGGRHCPFLLGSCDMLLLKVNKINGDLIWDKTMNFGGNGYDEVDGIELKEDGIYCGGWAHELESGFLYPDVGLWKLDYDGNTMWTNYFGKLSSGEHQDGHFVVDDSYIYAAGLWGGRSNFNAYNGSAFLGRFDKTDGVFIDSTLFGTQSDNFLDAENALGMTSYQDFLYITGYTTPLASNDWQIFVAKYDKDLNQVWYTDWGGSVTESARGIRVFNDVVYVAGLTSSPSIMSGGKQDAVLLKLDTDGNMLSYQTWGNDSQNGFLDLVVNDSAIYLTGTTFIDSASNQKTAFLLKVDNNLTQLEKEINIQEESVIVFPNPSYGKLNVEFQNRNQKRGTLTITDGNGMLVEKRNVGKSDRIINLSLEKSGVYFVTFDNGVFRVTKKIINK